MFNRNMTDEEIKMLNLKFVYKGTKDCRKNNEAYVVECADHNDPLFIFLILISSCF